MSTTAKLHLFLKKQFAQQFMLSYNLILLLCTTISSYYFLYLSSGSAGYLGPMYLVIVTSFCKVGGCPELL